MQNTSVGKAIASMVLGIVSVSIAVLSAILFFFLFPLGVGCGIASLICGIIAIVLGNKARPLGRAIAGFVLGIAGSSLSGSTILIAYVIKMLI